MKNEGQKKRILVVCQHFWPENFRINDIVDYLVHDKDVEVDVLCGIPNYPSGSFSNGYSYFKNRKQEHNGVKIRRVFEIPRGNNSNIRIFLNYISFPLASLLHIPRLATRQYDKVFIYQLSPVMMSLSGLLIGKIKKIETIMYVLDLWPENLYSVLGVKNKKLRTIAEKVSHWHYKNASKLIALSDDMKNKLSDITKKDNDMIMVIPQAAEKIYETPVRDTLLHERFSDKFTVLFTGNISPAQSLSTIVEAASIIEKQGYSRIHWVIVGDGMSRNETQNQVKKAGLTDRFTFEGHKAIDFMPKYLELANVLVGTLVKSPLLEATVPAKVMSYIAAGKPIVLSMDGEAQELISKKIKCGYAGEAGNARLLAENIIKMYSLNSSDRKALGERASKYHKKHFERTILMSRLYKFMWSK